MFKIIQTKYSKALNDYLKEAYKKVNAIYGNHETMKLRIATIN